MSYLRYEDGNPVTLERGAMGLNPDFSDFEAELYWSALKGGSYSKEVIPGQRISPLSVSDAPETLQSLWKKGDIEYSEEINVLTVSERRSIYHVYRNESASPPHNRIVEYQDHITYLTSREGKPYFVVTRRCLFENRMGWKDPFDYFLVYALFQQDSEGGPWSAGDADYFWNNLWLSSVWKRDFFSKEFSDSPRFMSVGQRHNRSSVNHNTTDKIPLLEFVAFGKSHRFYAYQGAFMTIAPFFRNLLVMEARVLVQSLRDSQWILHDFVRENDDFAAWLVAGVHRIRGFWPFGNKLQDANSIAAAYAPLENKAFRYYSKVASAKSLTYGELHRIGVEFHKIKYEQCKLNEDVKKFIGQCVESAEMGEEWASTVEEKSFKVLDLYGQARYAKNPAGLAAYRIGILSVRLLARSTGHVIADDSAETLVRALCEELKKDVPAIVTDFLLAYVKKGAGVMEMGERGTAACEGTVKLCLVLLTETLIWVVFDREKKPKPVKSETFLFNLCLKVFLDEIPALAMSIVGAKKGKEEERKKKLVTDIICLVVASALKALMSELQKMYDKAEKEKVGIWNVLCSDIGTILVNLLWQTIKNIFWGAAEKAMGWYVGERKKLEASGSEHRMWPKSVRRRQRAQLTNFYNIVVGKGRKKSELVKFELETREVGPNYASKPYNPKPETPASIKKANRNLAKKRLNRAS